MPRPTSATEPRPRFPLHGWLLVASVALGGACVGSDSTRCGDLICPEGFRCHDFGDRKACVLPWQLIYCEDNGIEDEERCDREPGDGYHCEAGVCIPGTCGDGVWDSNEECDQGEANADDVENACRTDCHRPICGDGVRDASNFEECDEGAANSDAPDASCRTDCREPRCGDGITDPGLGEVCDDGNLIADDDCTPDCASEGICGNGYVDFLKGELCDDGNRRSQDGCTSQCHPESLLWEAMLPPTTSTPSERRGHAAVFDARSGRGLIFGGLILNTYLGDTWTWDGASWTQRQPATSPPARFSHAMAYDHDRGRVVLFGGQGPNNRLGDTWEWDGASWTQRQPTTAPAARFGHAMTYDAARDRVVLFGGALTDNVLADDTWEWDGEHWNEIPVPAADRPTARAWHSLAYDPIRGRVVLFGGENNQPMDASHLDYGDTWEWDGTTWTERSPASGPVPAPRNAHAMSWDPAVGKVVLYAGRSGPPAHVSLCVYYEDAWAWDGAAWTPLSLGTEPGARFGHTLYYDLERDELVLFGGMDGLHVLSDLWQSSGGAWTKATAPLLPPARASSALVRDPRRGTLLLFGGDDISARLDDTWTWDGGKWQSHSPADAPTARDGHALATDIARDRVVLFGGETDVEVTAETWEWDGTTWTERTPTTAPDPRRASAMAYDPLREVVVLFGGQTGTTEPYAPYGDTWEWDGTTWTERTPATSPPARSGHGLVWDPRRQVVVLHGGRNGWGTQGPYLDDTWEWDGTTWTERTQSAPSAAGDFALAMDPLRGVAVRFAGFIGSTRADQTWELRDVGWRAIELAIRPPPRSDPALAYDPRGGGFLLLGGRSRDSSHGIVALNDFWRLRFEGADPREACGPGFDRDGDGLVGCADPDCWARCDPTCPPTADSCAADRPRCGDGTCSAPLETCRLCPDDCGACPAQCGDFHCDAPETAATCPGDCS